MKKEKKKLSWQKLLAVVFPLLLGAACGVVIVAFLLPELGEGMSFGEYLFQFALLLAGMYLVMFLHIIVHESGHLVFGLLTGYRFSSFRIGSFMLVKERGQLRFKRMSLAGTGGQCLLCPPELQDGKIPYVLYNLGGSLMNLVLSLLCLLLYLLWHGVPYLSPLLLMSTVIGVFFALFNGIPLRMNGVDNDGRNALSLGKDAEALRAFWVQMKINEQIARGIRPKDMPEEWFAIPTEKGMQNGITSALAVFRCNRLVDEQRFDEADALMAEILNGKNAVLGLYKNMLRSDRIYCELIGENRTEVLNSLLTREQKKFMKAMKNFPSVLRTQYAYALLAERDEKKAGKYKTLFEKAVCCHPYQADIESERELIKIAEEKAEKCHSQPSVDK